MADEEITTEEIKLNDFPQTYIKFRSTLDALETTAMRYFLKDADEAGRTKRAEELETKFMLIIKEYQNQNQVQSQGQIQMLSAGNPGKCPEGYFNCNGCCLPYPCP